MTKEELNILQHYPLDIKIEKTKARLREWVKYWGEENVYISFSGGKDSTVLLDIARREYPNIKAVFCDTGLEYPEIKDFVKQFDNVEIVRPKKSFKEVITKYGYPIISKEQSACIHEIRTTKSEYMLNRRLYGDSKGRFKLSKKWHYLLAAPFKISSQCCYHLKKSPMNSYNNRTKSYPILATLAEESMLRLTAYLKSGCNSFEGTHPHSQPMSFWTSQDILQYIVENDLEIASCYGEIKQNEDGEYYMDGINRTGCIFCAFGVHREKCPNKFQRLKDTHTAL